MKLRNLLALTLLLLTACVTPTTPSQTIYLAESNYAVALRLELAYSALPRCKVAEAPCSDVSVIKTVQKADDVAWSAIKNAQTAVRTPGFGDAKVTTAVASAQALTQAFLDITKTLGVK